jgi:hypothetical protein
MVENMSAAFDVPSHSVQVSITTQCVEAVTLCWRELIQRLRSLKKFITDTFSEA